MAHLIGLLHVPKTGGTSLREAFEQDRTVWRPRGARYTRTLSEVDLRRVEVVTGHIPFTVMDTLPVTEWVTVLRHPVDRWLSHYFAEAGPGGTADPSVVPDNMTVRMLADFTVDLDAAMANLARFDHIGFTDRLADTFTRYGLTPKHRRVSPHRPRGDQVPTWLIAEAVNRNQADLTLWTTVEGTR